MIILHNIINGLYVITFSVVYVCYFMSAFIFRIELVEMSLPAKGSQTLAQLTKKYKNIF